MNKFLGGAIICAALLYVLLVVSANKTRGRRGVVTSLSNSKNVRLVAVVTRHGDRTPIFSFPPAHLEPVTWNCELPATIEAVPIQIFDVASPPFPRLYRKIYKKDIETFAGNCAAGQLTVTGMKQHFDLGTRLRKQYSALLENVKIEFGSKNVYVESSDIPRTFLSAQSQLLALFPPKPAATLNTADVIPIITTELAVSDFFPNYATCPRLAVIRDAVLKSKPFRDFETKILPFKNDLARKLKYVNGSSVGFPAWTQIYDTFACRRAHQFPFPPEFTTALVDQAILTAEQEYQFLLNDREYLRLGIGPFFARLKEKLSDMVTGRNRDLKYALFSGHDSTLAPLLSLLGIYDGYWPPYASNLVFEVIEDDAASEANRWSVRVIYNEKELIIPGCPPGQACPWNVFDQITKPFEIKSSDKYAATCKV